MKKIYSACLATTVFMTACSQVTTPPNNISNNLTTPIPTATSWAQRQAQLSAISSWQLQGVMGVTQLQPSKRWSASVNWAQQNRSNYKLRLYGPFGAGAVVLQGVPGEVSLTSNDHPKPVVAKNAQSLVAQETGWQWPVDNMYYWVRGLPVPGVASSTTLDNQHRLTTLKQEGWLIQYPVYAQVHGIDMPKQIIISNAQFNFKLIIKNWQI